jgi:hypothetical protein
LKRSCSTYTSQFEIDLKMYGPSEAVRGDPAAADDEDDAFMESKMRELLGLNDMLEGDNPLKHIRSPDEVEEEIRAKLRSGADKLKRILKKIIRQHTEILQLSLDEFGGGGSPQRPPKKGVTAAAAAATAAASTAGPSSAATAPSGDFPPEAQLAITQLTLELADVRRQLEMADSKSRSLAVQRCAIVHLPESHFLLDA